MNYISGIFKQSGGITWQFQEGRPRKKGEGLTISFRLFGGDRREVLSMVADFLERNDAKWLRPAGSLVGDWLLDIDALKASPSFKSFESLQSIGWLCGKIKVLPECKEGIVQFIVTPRELTSDMPLIDLPELAPFIERFKVDHPDPQLCAFLIMKYEKTLLHGRIIKAVRGACSRYGIEALRADDKYYADELLPNVRTYMLGCGFGIAIFERLTEEDFNPNVSLEVGYMMAQGKPICLLKDSTLSSLHTDLVGRLYEVFDTQRPEETIPPVLEKWLKDKEIV